MSLPPVTWLLTYSEYSRLTSAVLGYDVTTQSELQVSFMLYSIVRGYLYQTLPNLEQASI
jgi:hypothetical protein